MRSNLVLRITHWRHCIFIAFGLRLQMARLFKIVGCGSEHVVGPSRSDAIAMLADLRNDLPSFTWRLYMQSLWDHPWNEENFLESGTWILLDH